MTIAEMKRECLRIAIENKNDAECVDRMLDDYIFLCLLEIDESEDEDCEPITINFDKSFKFEVDDI